MREFKYALIVKAIRKKLLLAKNMSEAEIDALNRQLAFLESLQEPSSKSERPNA